MRNSKGLRSLVAITSVNLPSWRRRKAVFWQSGCAPLRYFQLSLLTTAENIHSGKTENGKRGSSINSIWRRHYHHQTCCSDWLKMGNPTVHTHAILGWSRFFLHKGGRLSSPHLGQNRSRACLTCRTLADRVTQSAYEYLNS